VANDNNDAEAQARYKKDLMRKLREMQIEQEKKGIAKRIMEPDAYERLMNVRVANYELYSQLLEMLISMARSERLKGKITEAQLRELLSKLTYKPNSTIEFKHK
jgi:programmed cell death protein 5